MSLARGAAAAVLLGLLASPQPARAEPDRARMSSHMHEYFDGESRTAYAACGLAAASGVAGGFLLAHASDGTRAAAIPVLVVGAGELAIGIGLLARTGPQVRALDEQLATSPDAYVKEEGARMERVYRNFTVYRAIEAVLLVGGLGTAAVGFGAGEDRATGAGLGVASQVTVIMILDALAERRAEVYLDAIHDFSAAPVVAPSAEGSTYGLTVGGAF